jgi:hypothetical protein
VLHRARDHPFVFVLDHNQIDGGTTLRTEETIARMTEKCIIQCRCTQMSTNYKRQSKQKEDECPVNAAGDCSSVKASVT